MQQLRIRIDDVLLKDSSFEGNPEARVRKISRWLNKSSKILHVPTILVKDIQSFPSIIDFIVKETYEKRMFPALHGWEHVDYNKLSEAEIAKHLDRSVQWFEKTLGFRPSLWATPWGAESSKLSKVASDFGMIVEGVGSCIGPAQWLNQSKSGNLDLSVTVMEHWWKKGSRLLRIAHVLNYGSYEEAARNEDVF